MCVRPSECRTVADSRMLDRRTAGAGSRVNNTYYDCQTVALMRMS
jgi:hypothetical protein